MTSTASRGSTAPWRGRKIIPSQLCPSSVGMTIRSVSMCASSLPKDGGSPHDRCRVRQARVKRVAMGGHACSRSQRTSAWIVTNSRSAKKWSAPSMTDTCTWSVAAGARDLREPLGLLERDDDVGRALDQQDRRPDLGDLQVCLGRRCPRTARMPPGAVRVDLGVLRAGGRPATVLDDEQTVGVHAGGVVDDPLGAGVDLVVGRLGTPRGRPSLHRLGQPPRRAQQCQPAQPRYVLGRRPARRQRGTARVTHRDQVVPAVGPQPLGAGGQVLPGEIEDTGADQLADVPHPGLHDQDREALARQRCGEEPQRSDEEVAHDPVHVHACRAAAGHAHPSTGRTLVDDEQGVVLVTVGAGQRDELIVNRHRGLPLPAEHAWPRRIRGIGGGVLGMPMLLAMRISGCLLHTAQELWLSPRRVREIHDVRQASGWRGFARVTAGSQVRVPAGCRHRGPPSGIGAMPRPRCRPSRMVDPRRCRAVRVRPEDAGRHGRNQSLRPAARPRACRAPPVKQGGGFMPVATSGSTRRADVCRDMSLWAGSGDRHPAPRKVPQ